MAEYTARRDRWLADQKSLEKLLIQIGNGRLALGMATVLLAYLAFGQHILSGLWLLIPIGVFVASAVWHERVIRRQTLARRAVAHYDRALARLEDRWQGTGVQGTAFQNSEHVYADDLDVFGKGSLFELVNAARTTAGEKSLANWLLAPASLQEVLARQEAVRELSSRLDLREDIALLGEDIRADLDADKLGKWGSAALVHFPSWLRVLAAVLATAGTVALLLVMLQIAPVSILLAVAGLELILIFSLRQRVTSIIDAVENSGRDLGLFSTLVSRMEREFFESLKLKELRARLDVLGSPASKRIARLERWVDWLDSSDHLLVKAIRPVVLWREQIAMGVEAWRKDSGAWVGLWLEAIAQFEALSSLATLAFERPDWSFPALLQGGESRFEAYELRHPLLASQKCVPNDVSIGGELRLLIVSGSNMSGKSTLLRSIGLNTVLAWAGAPVAAMRMQISPLQTTASMRVVDSLLDNRSRFFAEITRLRQIVELAKGPRPVLFLLDELLSGTNSHDRRIGAAAVLKSLVQTGAIGLVTTHDLALANIKQELDGHAENVHFDDRIEDGRMVFDYRMRPGVVTHSNALELMRAVGLDV